MTEPRPRVPKRLIVCCDGTWQSSVSGEKNIPSNVTRLCRHLSKKEVRDENGKLWNQIVHYDAGIGTGDLTFLERNFQGGTGAGLSENVVEAYNFLVLNYQPGDKIYCFGFSRGAYTARSLACFITSLGICSPLDMQAFPYIYSMYEKAIPERAGEKAKARRAREDFWGTPCRNGEKPEGGMVSKWLNGESIRYPLGDGKPGSIWIETGPRMPITDESKAVEVVGVWDTVGALGIPKILGRFKLHVEIPFVDLDKPSREFHDVGLNNNVHHAYHALALDERRSPFSPALWYVPEDQPRKKDTLRQVWFPGVHINVGGGSDDVLEDQKSDFEQIANVTFAWMVEQVRPHLAFEEQAFDTAMDDQIKLLAALHDRPRPYPWPKSYIGKAVCAPRKLWHKLRPSSVPRIKAEPGWATGEIVDSYTDAGLIMKLGGSRYRSPGETMAPANISDKKQMKPLVELGLPFTGEMIHPCVWHRMQKLGTQHPALKGWHRVRCSGSERGWVWKKDGVDLTMPEYRIALDSTQEHNYISNKKSLIISSVTEIDHSSISSADEAAERPKPRNIERLVAERYEPRLGNELTYLEKLDRMYEHGEDLTQRSLVR